MNDTPEYIRRIYSDYIMKKSDSERFKMGFEMADIGQRVVEQRIGKQHPDWSVGEVKAAVFEQIYRNDFSTSQMNRIKSLIMAYYQPLTF
ncbi:hypothetical protein [Spirosoma panaciterrae]|uniref:hypothetical protein n=1 Tax=Spirosoma panaciterrae TaxID=496058 RepID=UPI0003688DE5|nr:hypothetical protein [Spirosoma panaciterrae]